MNLDKSKIIVISIIVVIISFLIGYPMVIKSKKKSDNSVAFFQVPGELEEYKNDYKKRIEESTDYDYNENYVNVIDNSTDSNNNNNKSEVDSLRDLVFELQRQLNDLQSKSTNKRPDYSRSKSSYRNKPTVNSETKNETKEAKEESQIRIVKDGFYSNGDNSSVINNSLSVKAFIPEEQSITNGSKVKIITSESATIGGKELKKNSYIYGEAKLSKERVIIKIKSILINNSIVNTDISIFDIDGTEGIYTPGLMVQDLLTDNTSRSVSRANVNLPIGARLSLNPAKKKLQQPTVTLLNGHKVILSIKSN